MPFFIPEALLRFEYLKGEKIAENAKPYLDDMDFAFFCVNFGYSKADYNALTPKEKAFIMKAYENKTVRESTLLRDAVLNAVSNAFRKKGKSFKKLWKKLSQPISEEQLEEDFTIINEVEKREGKAWIELLYRGMNNG